MQNIIFFARKNQFHSSVEKSYIWIFAPKMKFFLWFLALKYHLKIWTFTPKTHLEVLNIRHPMCENRNISDDFSAKIQNLFQFLARIFKLISKLIEFSGKMKVLSWLSKLLIFQFYFQFWCGQWRCGWQSKPGRVQPGPGPPASSTTTWIFFVQIGFGFRNLTQIHVEKFFHCLRSWVSCPFCSPEWIKWSKQWRHLY